MLMFITDEAALTLMLPPKAIVGPPIRTMVPGFMAMETHTLVDAALQPTEPPCVKLAVPTMVPPTVMSKVDAEAAGTIAMPAPNNRIKSLVLIRTITPPLIGRTSVTHYYWQYNCHFP